MPRRRIHNEADAANFLADCANRANQGKIKSHELHAITSAITAYVSVEFSNDTTIQSTGSRIQISKGPDEFEHAFNFSGGIPTSNHLSYNDGFGFQVLLIDEDSSILTSTALPLTLTLADFEFHKLLSSGKNDDGNQDILQGQITSLTRVGLNEPPTADAGGDQPIHAGNVVNLNGDESFDDNTATDDLEYLWSITDKPMGSIASLDDPSSYMPSFIADLPGSYVVTLVVTDEDGLLSPADTVGISSINLAPTAAAGDDKLVFVFDSVFLDGSGSTDPEYDPLTFAWTITAAPAGSGVMLSGASSVVPSLAPDVDGVYEITLVVSDFWGPGLPDSVEITATTAEYFAEEQIVSVADDVSELDPESGEVTTQGNQTAFGSFLIQAMIAIQEGDIAEAINKLEKAILRTDGCAIRGSPDGNGPGRDWITTCDAQTDVYNHLSNALNALTP